MWRTVFATSGEDGPTAVAGDAQQAGGVTTVDVTDPTALVRHLADDTTGAAADAPTLVVSHEHDQHALRVAVSFLCSARPDALVARATTPHAPVAAVAALAHAATVTTDAGVGLDLWRRSLDGAWSAAVLRTVANLSSPSPSMRQHVASWRPTSRFLVRHAPSPGVVAATRLQDALADLPAAAELVVHRPGEGTDGDGPDEDPVEAIVDLVAESAGSVPVRDLRVQAGSTRLYGTVEEAQLALVPRPALPRSLAPCHGCGLHLASSACGFCGTRRRAVRPATGAPRAGRRPASPDRAAGRRVPVQTARQELARTEGPA